MNPLDNTELPPARYVIGIGHVVAELKTETEHRIVVETPIFAGFGGLSESGLRAIAGQALELMGPRKQYTMLCPPHLVPDAVSALRTLIDLGSLAVEMNWDIPRDEIVFHAGAYAPGFCAPSPEVSVRFRDEKMVASIFAGSSISQALRNEGGDQIFPERGEGDVSAPAPVDSATRTPRGHGAADPILPSDPPVSDKL